MPATTAPAAPAETAPAPAAPTGYTVDLVPVGAITVHRFTVGNGTGPILRGRFTLDRPSGKAAVRFVASPAFTVERPGADESGTVTGERTFADEAADRFASALAGRPAVPADLAGLPSWTALVGAVGAIPPGDLAEVILPGAVAVPVDSVVAALAAYRAARSAPAA